MGAQQTIEAYRPEPIQRAPERTQRARVEPPNCSLCSDRHDRPRQSVCTCNHCSRPLCSDCMASHVDELPQTITQFTHQLNQLEQEFDLKQVRIQEEVSESTDEIVQYFQTYINELMRAYQTILIGVVRSEQDAKEYLDRLALELQTIRTDIATLAAETTFQPNRVEALSAQLNQIQERLQTYEATKEAELQTVLPTYTLRFQCVPATTTNANGSSEAEPSNLQDNSRGSSNRRQRHHPYRSSAAAGLRRNTSSRN